VDWRPQPFFNHGKHGKFLKVVGVQFPKDRSGVGVLTEIATEPVTPHFKPEL
jgi:hypothetical protein